MQIPIRQARGGPEDLHFYQLLSEVLMVSGATVGTEVPGGLFSD